MKRSEAVERTRLAVRQRHYSIRTEQSYCGWVDRFCRWKREQHGVTAPNECIAAYLSELAPHIAASTQRQGLNALVFFFQSVLGQQIGKIPEWLDAQRPARLPEWLTDTEAARLLSFLKDDAYLVAALMYGSGLRIGEAVSLRLRDLQFEQGCIVVRGGKGDKDRTTCLPKAIVGELRLRVERSSAVHRRDVANGQAGVYVPPSVAHKQPMAAQQLQYFWLFPAAGFSRDPRSQSVRRHHLHTDTIAKQLRTAAALAQITRRVTCHSLRHSFATQYLLNGGTLHELKELLGHASIQTTEIYLHCLPQLGARITSPMDAPRAGNANVIEFAPLLRGERAEAEPVRMRGALD